MDKMSKEHNRQGSDDFVCIVRKFAGAECESMDEEEFCLRCSRSRCLDNLWGAICIREVHDRYMCITNVKYLDEKEDGALIGVRVDDLQWVPKDVIFEYEQGREDERLFVKMEFVIKKGWPRVIFSKNGKTR